MPKRNVQFEYELLSEAQSVLIDTLYDHLDEKVQDQAVLMLEGHEIIRDDALQYGLLAGILLGLGMGDKSDIYKGKDLLKKIQTVLERDLNALSTRSYQGRVKRKRLEGSLRLVKSFSSWFRQHRKTIHESRCQKA